MNIRKIWNVLKKEGIVSFCGMAIDKFQQVNDVRSIAYLLRIAMLQRQPEEKKYMRFQKECEPYLSRSHSLMERPSGESIGVVVINEEGLDASGTMKSLQAQKGGPVEAEIAGEGQTVLECIKKLNASYVGFVYAGDYLAKSCMQELLNYLAYIRSYLKKDAAVLYTDEDQIVSGQRKNPFFKSNYMPDLIWSYHYIGGFWCAKKALVLQAAKRQQGNGRVGEYELLLRVTKLCKINEIYHLQQILYHRGVQFQYRAQQMKQLEMIKGAILQENGIEAEVVSAQEDIPVQHIYYKVLSEPLVSIIIPSKDNPKLLRQCLNSIEKNTKYSNYEAIVVDNGSNEANRKEYERILNDCSKKTRYHYEKMEFNFAKMCNIGAELADGEYVLFMNDDIECLPLSGEALEGRDWLGVLLGHAMQPHAGGVEGKLLFPNSSLIQHIGVVNYEKWAEHIFSHYDDQNILKEYRNRADYNYMCVTAACLLIEKRKFFQVHGFTTELAVTFNDVELCMKLFVHGYYQVVRNDVVMYHHESLTRGRDSADKVRLQRHLRERAVLFSLQPQYVRYDPLYSSFLSQQSLDASINTDFHLNLPAFVEEIDRQDVVETNHPNWQIKLDSIVLRERLEMRGYAYEAGKGAGGSQTVYLALKGKETAYCMKAVKLFDPKLAMQLGVNEKINFAQFFCAISPLGIKPGAYELFLSINNKKGKKRLYKNTGEKLYIMIL